MNSLILRWSARYILAIALPFSIWILLRGHNAPGGGFIGGLIAASGLALYALSVGTREVRSVMRLDPKIYVGLGLLCAAASGLPGLLGTGQAFLTHRWLMVAMGGDTLHLGTTILFDIGVYLVVVGALLTILLEVAET